MKRSLGVLFLVSLLLAIGSPALASPILRAEVTLPGKKAVELKRDGDLRLDPLESEGTGSKILNGPAEPVNGGEPALTIHRYYASGYADVTEYFPGQGGTPGRFRVRYTGKEKSPPWAANGWYSASEEGERWVSEVLARHGRTAPSRFPTLPVTVAASAAGLALVAVALRLRRTQG